MKPLFIVTFENQLEVFDQEAFHAFLKLCVMDNKDITTFNVVDLSRYPIDCQLVSKVVGIALLKYNRNLSGGELTPNFDKMYLYD